MTPVRKYQLLLVATVALFIYTLSGEVAGRYSQLWDVYAEFREKAESVREPQLIDAERSALLTQQKMLKDSLRFQSGSFEQSRTGVLDFVNVVATRSSVRLETLAPSREAPEGQGEEMGFKMTLTGPFHKIGLFLHELESGPFSFRTRKLELTRDGAPSGCVRAIVESGVLLAQ